MRTARRKAQRQERERQGAAVPPCILCIEAHHTVGRQHDPKLTDPLCEKHHREMHEQMRRAGISLTFEPDRVKRVATALRSAATYDRARADAMERWAELLDKERGEDQ
jgi:hypothetical protein